MSKNCRNYVDILVCFSSLDAYISGSPMMGNRCPPCSSWMITGILVQSKYGSIQQHFVNDKLNK